MAAALASLPGFTCQNKKESSQEPRLGMLVVPNRTITADKNTLRVLRLGQPQVMSFKIPLTKSHSIIRGPNRGEVLVTECGGAKALNFNWNTGEVKNQIQAEGNNVFGGHFTWWSEKKLLLCTEFNPASPAMSFVTVRDPAADFKIVHRMGSKGSRPHGVFVLEEGKTLAVQHFNKDACNNSYSPESNYSYFTLPDFKFSEQKVLSGNPMDLDFVPAFPSAVVVPKFSDLEKKIIAHEIEFKKMINPKVKVTATVHERQHKVLLWNLPNRKLVSVYDTGKLTPVEAAPSFDRTTLVIGTSEGKMIYVDLSNKEVTTALPEVNDLPLTSHFSII